MRSLEKKRRENRKNNKNLEKNSIGEYIMSTRSLQKLILEFNKLPGVGDKICYKICFFHVKSI